MKSLKEITKFLIEFFLSYIWLQLNHSYLFRLYPCWVHFQQEWVCTELDLQRDFQWGECTTVLHVCSDWDQIHTSKKWVELSPEFGVSLNPTLLDLSQVAPIELLRILCSILHWQLARSNLSVL